DLKVNRETWFCAECGQEIYVDDRFCEYCGFDLSKQ
ncbi:MAG: zinc-ribbon domain-containing protein, partial [Candidatus Heimdallarchaeota archaeon]|nr:zinc-ribbon domain-containing protein [Candidatus Heimdallarchaeota archaeon]